jgi:hypothetical protein
MVNLSDIGQLIQVPVEQVEKPHEFSMPAFQIAALSEKINQPNFRNWVPVLVQEPKPRQYKIVSNPHIFAAMELAGQEYVWVAVVPDTFEVEEHIKILSGQLSIKINICTADYEVILEGLLYLRQKSGQAFSKLDVTFASELISKASGRIAWKDFQPLVQLKCGFTKSNLKNLQEIFDVIPQPFEIHPIILNKVSEIELCSAFEKAACLPDTNLSNVNLHQLAHVIANEPDRKYWKDLKPLTKIKNGLSTAKLKGLNQIFLLEPELPPVPNTVRYLLELKQLAELKQEAKRRNISVLKGIKKPQLVELLSQKSTGNQ